MSRSRINFRRLLPKLTGSGYPFVCMLAILIMTVSPAQASMTYSFGSAPVVTDSSLVNDAYQINSLAEILAGNQSLIPVNITSSGLVNSTVDDNAIYSIALANSSTLSTDIELVTGSAAGSSLTSINAQENYEITTFAGVSASSVTSALTDAADGSLASLSGNSISAETGLNQSAQAVQGSVDTTFDSSHLGGAVITDSSPLLVGDAGLFAGSSQINRLVAPASGETDFAEVSGNQIALTANTSSGVDTGSPLSLTADENSIGAAFTGNSAENVVAVETGGATALTSSAGIANLQVNSAVAAANGDSASLSESSISVSVQTDAANTEDPLTASSISFDGNSLEASAVGSESVNQLTVAEGLNVDADGGQANSIDFTSGSETLTVEGGLFLGNAQLAIDSAVTARATGPATGPALSVDSRGLINSALSADGNSFEAIALGNDASSTLSVGGATSFTSTVAAQNVQASVDSAVSAVADSGTIEVRVGAGELATDPTTATLSETDTVSGSSISVDDNTVSALAVANRDPLVVSIKGTNVTDGISQVAGASLDYGTRLMASTAGLSAVSGQLASGSSVAASNTDAEISLSAGDFPTGYTTGPAVNNSTLTQSGNTVSSLANLNEGLVALGVEANAIDASSSVASAQNATVSNVTAVTSGIISTGINAHQLDSGSAAVNENLTVLVGDGDLSDDTDTGNSISATAGGNLNETVLDVAATTSMLVTGVIDQNGASSSVLSISAGPLNQAMAEMSVLTDQRLDNNTISATTEYSQIIGVIRRAEFDLADSTLNVDGNRITATARGNLTSNSLDFSALDIDMSAADATGGAAGSNLAATGAVQVIGESSIAAAVNAGGGKEIRGRMFSAGSDLANIALSVDQNEVVAAATGNIATSSLSGSGGVLAEDAPGTLYGSVQIGALPTDGVQIADTAVANAILQVNAGSVSASLATTGAYEIIGRIDSSATAINDNLDLSVDGNRAVAIATGSSAAASTELSFTTLESSAATVVHQVQSGPTTATVGGDGSVEITADIDTNLVSQVADVSNAVVSASGNTAGAQATGASTTASLVAGGEETVTLASGYGDGTIGSVLNVDLDNGSTQLSADYMLGVQQAVIGSTTAFADDMSVLATGGNFAGASLAADGNLLTAQGTGGSVAADLSLAATDMTAGGTGANTVNAILASEQFLTGVVDVDLTASDVTATAVNLTTSATGTNGSEAISVDDNTLLASGVGLKSVNNMTTDAATGVAGDGTTAPAVINLTLPSNGDVGLGNFDRLVVSFQDVNVGVDVLAASNSVGAAVTGFGILLGDIDGDTITVDGNTLLAQGTGASSSNTLATSAGASITDLSQAIVAGQDLDGAVTVANISPAATLDIAGISTDASLSVSENQLSAAATGLKGANTLSLYAPASISDGIDSLYTHDIVSVQLVGDSVSAGLLGSQVDLTVAGGDVLTSSLAANGNLQEASAQGATNTNTLTAESGAIQGAGFQIGALQWGDDPITASNAGSRLFISVEDGAATGSTLSIADNTIGATAGNLKGVNNLSVDSTTDNSGDAADTHYETINLSTTDLGGTSESDRAIVSLQAVTDDGDVTATIENSWMKIYVSDELEQESSAALTGNSVAASATVAADTNTLANSAGTLLDASSLVASVQDSSADAISSILGADLQIGVDSWIVDSKVDASDNTISAAATGLSATNTLAVAGGSIEAYGSVGGMIDADQFGQELGGFSAVASDQDISASLSASVEDTRIGVEINSYLSDSAVHVDENLIQASSTMAAAANTLNQSADTAMSNAPAVLSASQILEGDSYAEVDNYDYSYSGRVGTYVDGDVTASNLTVDNNAIQAVATGGTMTNTLKATAGTYIDGYNTWYSVVDSSANEFSGTYGLASRQESEADVSALVGGWPQISIQIGDGDADGNSTLSVSGNTIMSRATNLNADNTLVTEAGTQLDDVVSGILSYQEVAGETSAHVYGADTSVGVMYNLVGSAALDGNLLAAVATGGSVTNSLDVSAMSIDASPTSSDSTLVTSLAGLAAQSGEDVHNSLLNVQYRDAIVLAGMDSQDGYLNVAAGFESITGSVSVSENMMAAQARGLVAENSLSLTSETLIDGGSTALGSVQYGDAAVTASIVPGQDEGLIFLGADALTGTAVLDNNTVLASATSNLAVNSLSASAATQIVDLGTETTTTIGVAGTSITAGTVGFTLQNVQYGSVDAPVTASIQNMAIDSAIYTVTGTASVDGNTVMATARGQAAQNSLVLNAGTDLEASASLANTQVNGGAVNASIGNGRIALNTDTASGTVSVSDNTVQASGTANLAINSIDISGTLAASDGGSAAGLTASADYVALNAQTNTADVTSAISGYTIALNSLTSTTGTASVDDNIVLAEATGNSASNTFTITTVGGSDTADFAFTGVQMNSGNVSSSISGVSISLSSLGGTGNFSAVGNRIGSVSTGNVSVSSIKSGL